MAILSSVWRLSLYSKPWNPTPGCAWRHPLAGRHPGRADRGGALLAPLDKARLSAEQRAALDLALAEYRQAQELNADRPEAHLNLGVLQAQLGKPLEAERAYRTALRIDPSFAPTYVNLADLYRAQQRDEEGENILRQGLAVPNDAACTMRLVSSWYAEGGIWRRSAPWSVRLS